MILFYLLLIFFNYYIFVIGLCLDYYGIVNNSMDDEVLGWFELSNCKVVIISGWWGGELIWVSVENVGVCLVIMVWLGSEFEIRGVCFSKWCVYDGKELLEQWVSIVFDWLVQIDVDVLCFIMLYMEYVDKVGYYYGFGLKQYVDVIVCVDQIVGQVFDGLQQCDLVKIINVIVVFDYGMVSVVDGNVIVIELMVDLVIVCNIS